MHGGDYELDLNYQRPIMTDKCLSTKNKRTQIQSKHFNKAL